MSREAQQVEAVERLLDQTMAVTGFGYDDDFVTVPVGQVRAALKQGSEEFDRRQHEVAKIAEEQTLGICPECEQGKHGNCDGMALNALDNFSHCRCAQGGHGE